MANISSLQLPRIIAHRGARVIAPENTLASLLAASQLKAAWVEFDVQLTRDAIPIIIHDKTLSRTTNGRGAVSRKVYSDIRKLDAGIWFDAQFQHEHIPSLEEYLHCARDLKIGVNLELKPSKGKAAMLSEKVFDCLNAHWAPELPPPLISSFSRECLITMKQLHAPYFLAMNFNRWHRRWRHTVDELGLVSLHFNKRVLEEKKVMLLKKAGLKVCVFTVNQRETALKLFDMGVDAVFSDYPDLLSN